MLSIEKQEKIIELNNLSIPKTKIAEQIGCSLTAVYNCLKRNNITDEMIGQKFGKLTVLKRIDKPINLQNRCKYYLCKCDCGKEIEVQGSALRQGHTTSCGCSRKRKNEKDLKNQRFGKLIVIDYAFSKNRRSYWNCLCDCGNECIVSSQQLLNGDTKSCGCLHSWKEKIIENFLIKRKIPFQKEYGFDDLKEKKKLRFDFAVFDQNKKLLFLIEYQGEQHFNKDNKWHTSQLENSDKKKKEYCIKNNIPLYELTKKDIIEEKLKEIIYQYGY